MTDTDFLFRTLPGIGKRVLRLGLASSYGIETAAVDEALRDGGINYLYWTPRMGRATPAVKRALRRDRERYVLASGPATAWWAGNLRRFVHTALRILDTDYLDVLQMHTVGLTSFWRRGTIEQLLALRRQGRVRAIGISTHNLRLAGRLATDSALDLLMVRYNAVHRAAETRFFPLLPPQGKAVVTFTATSWRQLLRRPRGWTGPLATAGHCYRFCLSNPAVDVVLTGPRNGEQLRSNLQALHSGPLNDQEMAWMRELGRAVS